MLKDTLPGEYNKTHGAFIVLRFLHLRVYHRSLSSPHNIRIYLIVFNNFFDADFCNDDNVYHHPFHCCMSVYGIYLCSGKNSRKMNTERKPIKNSSSSEETLKPKTIIHNYHTVFHSFAMLAAMELEVFTPLKDGPMSAAGLAGALGVQEDKLTPLLYSLVAAGLLQVEDNNFSNTEEAAKFLVRGRPEYLGGLSGFYKRTWTSALKTAETLQTGKPQAKLDFRNLSDEEMLTYFQKQIHSSFSGGKEIAAYIDFSTFKHLLDAGGGTGGVAMAVCTQYPHLKATVADFPKVTELAERFIAERGLSDRISVSPTDLCSRPPTGIYDVAVLRALIQTLAKKEAQLSLKHIGQSLNPGGQIFIFGSVLQNSRLAPAASVANNLIFLNVYDHGRSYTEQEYQEMLANAGFMDITVKHEVLADGMGLVKAQKQ